MPAERYFINAFFALEQTLLIEDQELHHLQTVMRTKIGDEIELVNGQNQLAIAKVNKIDKKRAEIQIESVQSKATKEHKLILAQAIPRFNRLEFILEKGTELGVDEFWLFPGIYSEKDLFSFNQHKRMEQLLISAMKQCGRWDLPFILEKPPLAQWTIPSAQIFFGDTKPSAPLFMDVLNASIQTSILLLIGPEKGFHPQEIAFLEHIQAQGVKLNQNILRVDTAAISALSLLGQHVQKHICIAL